MLWAGIITSLVCEKRNSFPSCQKQPSVSSITFWPGNYFDVITTSALDDIVGSIEGNPSISAILCLSNSSSVRIAMVSTKYLCCTIDDIAAAYPLAKLTRSGLFTYERASSMHNSTPPRLVFNHVSTSPFFLKALCRLIHKGQIYNTMQSLQINSVRSAKYYHCN